MAKAKTTRPTDKDPTILRWTKEDFEKFRLQSPPPAPKTREERKQKPTKGAILAYPMRGDPPTADTPIPCFTPEQFECLRNLVKVCGYHGRFEHNTDIVQPSLCRDLAAALWAVQDLLQLASKGLGIRWERYGEPGKGARLRSFN